MVPPAEARRDGRRPVTLWLLLAALASTAVVALSASWQTRTALQAELRTRPQAGLALLSAAVQAQQAELAGQAERLATDRGFAAYVDAALSRTPVDAFSLRDLLEERVDLSQAAGTMLFDAGGRPVLATGALLAVVERGDDLPGVAEVVRTGAGSAGFWRVAGTPTSVALSPVRQGPLLRGVLAFARPVAPATLTAIGQQGSVVLGLEIADGRRPDDDRGAAATGDAASDVTVLELPDFEGTALITAHLHPSELAAGAARQRALLLLAGLAGLLACLLAFWIARRSGRTAGAAAAPARRDDLASREGSARLLAWLESAGPVSPGPGSESFSPAAALPDRFQALARLPSAPGTQRLRVLDRQEGALAELLQFLPGQAHRTALAFRLGAEMKRAMAASHPALVRIVHSGQHQGTLGIAIEDLPGHSLADLLARLGPPPPAAGLLLARRIVAALTALHAARVVPWSLTAGQVLVQPGGQIRVLPLDPSSPFGARSRPDGAPGTADPRTVLLDELADLLGLLLQSSGPTPLDRAVNALLERLRSHRPPTLDEIDLQLAAIKA